MSETSDKLCTFDRCERAVGARGLCPGHYAQSRNGRPLTPLKSQARKLSACKFEGCNRSAVARDLCNSHWRQWRNGTQLREIRQSGHDGCSMKGCDHPYGRNGWCKLHAARELRGWNMVTDTPPVKVREARVCEFAGCDRPHLRRGLCNTHSQQQRSGKELTPIRPGGHHWRTGITGYGAPK